MFCRRCYRNMQNWDITAEEFRIKIMQGAVIIDVRSRQEYREGHLEGAINIPEFEARNRITKELPFSLQKRIEITVYYPNKSEYIYSNVFIVENDIKLETLIDSIRHELTKKNPIEVFF